MQNRIFKYLEYYLPVHNCIILPCFGGFIIDYSPALLMSNGEIIPPGRNVIFNPDLNHDDGILISYYIKDENISYNAASLQVKDFVRSIKSDLHSGKAIKCGNLGFLSLDEQQNVVFTPNKSFAPDFYGLPSFTLRRLSEIDKGIQKEKRYVSLKYSVGGIAAAVAALFLFIVPSTQIKDNVGSKNYQQSGFIELLAKHQSPVREGNMSVSEQTSSIPVVQGEIEKSAPGRTYYVIVGGEDSKVLADRLLNRIKDNGFENAAIVESAGRYRIYVASFTDKVEGEKYLASFREKNTKYSTAWLYSKRN